MLKLVSFLLVSSALFSSLTYSIVAALQGLPVLDRVYRRSPLARQGKSPECARKGSGSWYPCLAPGLEYCAIYKTTGNPHWGCVNASVCPAAATGFELVCDSTKDFCCCKADAVDPSRSESNEMRCNDLWNEKYDTVHKQACALPQLNLLAVCQTPTWTTPKPIFNCATQEPYGEGKAEECTDSDKFFCRIDKQTGSAAGCVPESDCPSGISGYRRGSVVCDNSAPYCCCPDDEGKPTRCNDIFNVDDNSAWRAACGQDELKNLWVCQRSWTTTPRPPPTPPHPPPPVVTAKNMTRHCLDYCVDNAPPGNPGPFKLRCGDPVPDQPSWNCPLDLCPRGCDRYCPDGEHLKCPKLKESPTDRPPRRTTESGLKPNGQRKDQEEVRENYGIWIMLAIVVLLAILGVVVYFLWFKKPPQNQTQQTPVITSLPTGVASTPATTDLSSHPGNLASSVAIQSGPQPQVPSGWQQAGYPQPR